MGCGYAICALLILGGAALLFVAQRPGREGRSQEAWIIGAFGAVLCIIGGSLLAPMQRAVARQRERARRELAEPHRPWTWDPAWTRAGGLRQSGRRHGAVLMLFGLVFFGVSAPIVWIALPQELGKGNYGVLLVLLFPLVGGWIFALALLDAWRRRKYGVARFVPAGLPVPLGGEAAGMVVVSRPVVPIGPGRVTLDCWRTTVTSSGGKRRHREDAVATTERELGPDAWTTTAGESQVFVRVPLRPGEPTSMHTLTAGRPTYEWRLRVAMPTAGADFAAEFVLPVFLVAATRAGEVRDAPADVVPTPLDRAEKWRAAGVREEPLAAAKNGRRLVLPANVGRPAMFLPLTMGMVLVGVAIALGWSGIWFAAGFVSLFALVPVLSLGPLWSGGGEKVWVEPDALAIERNGHVRRVPLAEIAMLESRNSVAVGHQKFHRVQARSLPGAGRRRGARIEIVSLVRGEEAAAEIMAWLGEQGVRPADPAQARAQ